MPKQATEVIFSMIQKVTAMSREDYPYLIALPLLALFIWLRDLSWVSTADDTLPILVSLPLFYWLGRPWSFKKPDSSPSLKLIIGSVVLFTLGIGLDNTLFLAIAWALLLWSWLSVRTSPSMHPRILKLMILVLMSFPWISIHAQQIGWWFRFSGATATAFFYSLLGYNVAQNGTNLLINGIPISVEVACAGLNTLQSMLIAGSAAAYLFLGETNRYYWNLPLLFILAWLANTIRIISVTASALLFGPKFALEVFHDFGGWLVLMVMFVLCGILFYLQEPKAIKHGSGTG